MDNNESAVYRTYTIGAVKKIMGEMPYSGSIRIHSGGEDFDSYLIMWMEQLKTHLEIAVESAKEDRTKLARHEKAAYGVAQMVEIIKEIDNG